MLVILGNIVWLLVGILFCAHLSVSIYQQIKSIKELDKTEELRKELKTVIEDAPQTIAQDIADKIEININGDYFAEHPFYQEDSELEDVPEKLKDI
ncbi:hypothetical protein JCM16358_23120 [Halanaerocella petrolearia]